MKSDFQKFIEQTIVEFPFTALLKKITCSPVKINNIQVLISLKMHEKGEGNENREF